MPVAHKGQTGHWIHWNWSCKGCENHMGARNQKPRPSASKTRALNHQTNFLGLMVVNFNYRFEYYYNNLQDKPFGYVYKVSSREISLRWKEPPPNVVVYHFMGWGPGLNKKEDRI